MIGKLLCWIGKHKWKPITKPELLWVSKWEQYEVCKGKCQRPDCGVETEIRREVWR